MRIKLPMRMVLPKYFLFLLFLVSLSGTGARAQQPAAAEAEALVKQGVASGTKGDIDAAIAAFDQAIKIDPQYVPAYQDRGYAFTLQNKLEEAISDYDKAIQLDPNYAPAYLNRGRAFSRQNKLEAAITDYDKAIELDPKNADAYYYRVEAKGRLGDYDAAIADSSRLLELQPQSAPAYYDRGHAKYFKGDLDGATSDLNQVIVLSPSFAPGYFIRGLVRHAQGDGQGAGFDFQSSADNGFYYGAFWLWIVKMEGSERGLARQTLSDYAAKPGFFKNDTWASLMADFFLEKITPEQLMAKAQQLGVTNDRLGEAWFYIGMDKYFSGDLPGARDCFKKTIAIGAKGSEEVVEAQREAAKLQTSGL